MTDHIPADKLREFVKDWREGIAKHPGRGDALTRILEGGNHD